MLNDWQDYYDKLEDKNSAKYPCSIWLAYLDDTTKNPVHWHCTKCWGEEFIIKDLQMVCAKCPESPKVIFCTPAICASS